MAYRTLLAFDPPVPVTLELIGTARARPLRVAGFGRDGRVHYVEAEDGERLPLAHIRRATGRRGQEIDLRHVILDRAEREGFRTGRTPRVPPVGSWERRVHDAKWGTALFVGLWLLGFVVWQITGREEDLLLTMAAGVGVVVLVGLSLLFAPARRFWAEVRLRLGLWR